MLFKIRDDPRVTPVGRLLRRFSLDELPQLINVLPGEMSLVGPRPPLPEEVALYQDDVRRRLLVKPGLTGLWQISGRSDLAWEESVRLDLRYVENWSLTLDLMILWKTMSAVVRGAAPTDPRPARNRSGSSVTPAAAARPASHVPPHRCDRSEQPAIGEVDLHVDDALLAEELAERAGALLLQLRAAGADGRTGDAESDAFLLAELAARAARRRGAVRGGPDPAARLAAERVWIVDPLDGTREFGEAGRADWAVHVALWERGELVGRRRRAARARRGRSPPTTRRSVPPAAAGALRIAVSRTRPPASSHAVAERARRRAGADGLGRRTRSRPCCAARSTPTCTPAASTSGTPPRRSRSRAPPGCTPAGSTARRWSTTEPDPWLPDLLVCRPELADRGCCAADRHRHRTPHAR